MKIVGAIGAGFVPVTVTLKALYGVLAGTVIVKIVVLPVSLGVMLVGLKVQVVPGGRLVRSHVKVTFEGTPAVRVATIVMKPEPPGASFTPPVLERE